MSLRTLRASSMKRAMLRPVVALSLMAGLVTPIAIASPAQAAGGTVTGPLVTAVQQFFQLISGGGAIAGAFEQLAREIQQEGQLVISEVDSVSGVAPVQACTTGAVDNFSNINLMTPANLQLFAENAVNCVALAQATINAVQPSNQPAIDAMGFAMNTVGPIAIVSSQMAGFSVTAVDNTLIAGENSLMNLLLPSCDFEDLTESGFFRWVCTEYNGDEGVGKLITNAENMASINTSRQNALTVVSRL
jgi:hypothetical protein